MKYRADIDGLRAIAVVLVILSHLQVRGFDGGFIGVDVFFVISGFLITSYLVSNLNAGTLSLREFYFRRAKRILPMAISVLLVTIAAGFAIFNSVKAQQITTDAYWATLFLENLRLLAQSTNYFNHGLAASPIQHYWSLAVEEQFYLVFPLLLLFVFWATRSLKVSVRSRVVISSVILVSAASLLWSINQGANGATQGYFSSLTRGYELGIGAILAIAVKAKIPALKAISATAAGVVGLALIGTSLFIARSGEGFPGALALLPTLGAAAIILAGMSQFTEGKFAGLISRALAFRPIVYLGKISFSLYLIHWPLIVFATQVFSGVEKTWYYTPAILIATLVLSSLTYRFIETPTRRIAVPEAWLREAKNSGRVTKSLTWAGAFASIALLASSAYAVTGGTMNPSINAFESVAAGNGGYQPNDPGTSMPTPNASDSPTASANPSATPSSTPSDTASPNPSPTGGPSTQPTKKPTSKPTPKPPTPPSLDSLLASWAPLVSDGTNLTQVPDQLTPPISALLGQRGVQWGQCMDPAHHQPTCSYGPSDAKHTAVILGDSYALAIYPMVINALGLSDWRVIGLNQRECMIADVVPWPWQGSGADLTCPDHRAWVNQQITLLKPDLVVLSDQPYHPIADGNQNAGDNQMMIWSAGLDSALATLRPLAKHIVYFGVPSSQTGLTDCVLAGGTLAANCFSSPRKLGAYENVQAQTSATYHIPFINPNDWLCVDSVCPPIIDNTPVFWDGAHFTQDFAAKLGPLFRAFLIGHKLI